MVSFQLTLPLPDSLVLVIVETDGVHLRVDGNPLCRHKISSMPRSAFIFSLLLELTLIDVLDKAVVLERALDDHQPKK